ncbi:hypothetical protein ACA910_017271 [Epithemia clementina (nom. ined.)]
MEHHSGDEQNNVGVGDRRIGSGEVEVDMTLGGNAAPGGASSNPRYQLDDRVFAKDGTLKEAIKYYPATIRERRCSHGVWQYKVHYQGWNSRWDQWLADDQIMIDSQQNRNLLATSELLGAHVRRGLSNNGVNVKRKRDDGRVGAGSRSNNKRRGGATATADAIRTAYEDFCELPFTLKTVLLDEKDQITRIGNDSPHFYDPCLSGNREKANSKPARLVHQLPAAVTIQQVLNHFCKRRSGQLASCSGSPSSSQSRPENGVNNGGDDGNKLGGTGVALSTSDVEDFCSGLCELFEVALPKILLYPQEKPQYDAFKKDKALSDKRLTEIYGCEYLLRLYVRLPVLMQSENPSEMLLSGTLLADFLVFLQKNRQACFRGLYREPRPDEWLDAEKALYKGHSIRASPSRGPMDL